MKQPSITIRYGASHNDLIVDGKSFDLAQLRKDRWAFTRTKNIIIGVRETLAGRKAVRA